MRIGIVLELRNTSGGIYQYSLTMLHALREWSKNAGSDQFVVLTESPNHPELTDLSAAQWTIQPSHPQSLKRTAKSLLNRFGLASVAIEVLSKTRMRNFDVDNIRSRPQDRKWLEGLGIDLMLFPTPQTRSFEIGLPYIMAIHDLQHRLQPQFPEVSANGEWEYREYLFRNGARHARIILADSEVGREDVLNFYGEYGVEPSRVVALPYLPASYLPTEVPEDTRVAVRKKYGLPERFLFYPAQFWPHKNHARIVRALGILKNEGLIPAIVFCGSSEGEIRQATLKEAMQAAEDGAVKDQVITLGYVPDQDMGALYAEAATLVMPTFFGPTNIPVLEAWRFGCPVITSDIRGIREQVGDAAIVVDPASVEAIADGIRRVWTDTTLCKTLATGGRRRLGSYTPDDFRKRLVSIIEKANAYGTD